MTEVLLMRHLQDTFSGVHGGGGVEALEPVVLV